ncbi:MAG: hypothetical protein Q4C79_02700 [Neisseria sp.]|uniref:hypothetical protein n=1 Tax=Neisseria sp. TaxID=192066 RepID=UPI0026DC2718|nr:hypothetical protein [Neisseria sp.]MDO4247866.1 hypothetical protein [Neisseria sp.]
MMKKKTRAIALTGILALLSTSAMAALPGAIFHPRGADVIQAHRQADDGFAAEFRLRHHNFGKLLQQIHQHAESQGFNVTTSDVRPHSVELTFQRDQQELGISLIQKDYGIIAYKADLAPLETA